MVTYWKSVLRTVRSSRSRFLAIFAIVALAVMFLSGLLVSTPYMQHSAGVYNRDSALMDIRIVGTLGLTSADAAAVSQIEGVGAVMPAYTVDVEVALPDGTTLTTRTHSVKSAYWGTDNPNYLNRPTLASGRWPKNAEECVIEGWHGDAEGLLNQTIEVLDPEDSSGISAKTLTVVGVVRSPYYLAKASLGNTSIGTGSLAAILYLDERCYDLEVYTDLYLTVTGADDCAPYSEEYEVWVDKVQSRVEHLGKTQRLVRRDQILEKAMAELNDAKATLDAEEESGRLQLEDAKLKLAKAEWQLELAFDQLTSGQAELDAGKAELDAAKAEYEAEIAAAKAEIAKNEALLEDAGIQLAEGQKQLDQGMAQLLDGEKQLAEGKEKLETALTAMEPMQHLVNGVEVLQTMTEQGYVSPSIYGPLRLLFAAFADEMEPQVEELRKNPTPTVTETFLLNFYDLSRALEGIDPLALDRQEKLTLLVPQMQAVRDGYPAAQTELADNQAALDAAETELADARAQLESAQAELDAGRKEYIDGMAELAKGKRELADAIRTAEAEFAAAEKTLHDSEATLEQGWADYKKGQKELTSGKTELEEQEELFRREIARGRREIEDAEAQIQAIEDPEWYVLDRSAIAAYVSYDSDSAKVGAIAKVFPLFFFLVAALVSSTTMTRMVEEERGQIGLLKALGYSNSAIASKFLSYAAAASALGSVVGLPIGLTIFPYVIYNAYGSAYYLPQMQFTNTVFISILSAGLIFLAIIVATTGALIATLRDRSAVLMRPKAPPAGKRILLERVTFIWRKLPFTWKVTSRNLFRYKKRLFMTLLGVAGCTALLVAALGIRDSIGGITQIQFNEIQTYELSLTLRKPEDLSTNEDLLELLRDPRYVEKYAAFHSETGVILGDSENLDVYVVAPEDLTSLPEFINFHHRTDKKSITLESDSVILTEKAASLLGVKPGDTITLRDGENQEVQLRVGGVMENYLFNYVYITQEHFEKAFGRECSFSSLYVRTNPDNLNTDAARDDYASQLISTGSVVGAVYNSSLTSVFDSVLDSIDYIVILIAFCAAALALVVLYNLTNINITERQKELATLKVLGFQRGELSAYIFREGIILTLLGSLAGLALGRVLLTFIVLVIEMSNIMFGRSIAVPSYLIAFTVTMGFSLLVNLIMEKKLRRINMAESLKAPE